MATPTVMKTDLNLPSNTAASISNIESDISTIESDIVTIEGDIVDINADLAAKVQTVETFAALATTPAPTAGMVVYLKQHTSGGIGGRHFKDTAGTITGYGGVAINNTVTAGRHWKQVESCVDVADFGATFAGDDTLAVQNAVYYCIANNVDLRVSGLCHITAPIIVDREVDGAAFNSYFTIYSDNGGGFYVDTSINLFTSSIPYTLYPVSQLVRWTGLRFVASYSSLTSYVMHGPRFLRSEFVNCNFVKIRLSTATTYYQSIYLINCQARRWAGVFMLGQGQAYDIQVIGGMYEPAGGAQCFFLQKPIGCKFFTQMEGCTGTALEIPDAEGVDISCYFEANGLDIDMRTGNTLGQGVNIHGSYFANSTTTYTVKWGACIGCSSTGNWHTNYMHDLLPESIVDINDIAQTSLSNLDAASHIGYRESTLLSIAIRGANSASYTVSSTVGKFCRNGKQTTVQFECTLTSTDTNPADQIFITSGMPTVPVSEMQGALCGSVEVVGSSVNNGISPLYCSSSSLGRFTSSINVIPANVSSDSWTLRFYISYMNA